MFECEQKSNLEYPADKTFQGQRRQGELSEVGMRQGGERGESCDPDEKETKYK